MPFSESIKQEARIKAHYRCCICEQIAPLEVHHIVPQEECNDNSFDNAVALCANCHNTYGDSRQHRKWIKEKRDWWYAHCEKEPVFMEKVEELYEIVVDSKNTNEAKFGRIESLIQGLATSNQQIISQLGSFPPEQKTKAIHHAASAASTISIAASAMAQLADRMSISDKIEFKLTKTCPKCGKQFSVVPEPNVIPICPKCGTPVTT